MSHHDGINDEVANKLRDIFLKEQLGATGKFPEGKLTPMDEGEIKIAIGTEKGKVVVHFGKEVAWIGFNKQQALDIAKMIIKEAQAL